MQRTNRRGSVLVIGVLIGVLTLFVFNACDFFQGTGVMEVSITDAPVLDEEVVGVYITVEEIQYHTTDDGWVTMEDFEGPQTHNLLDLTRGESEMLGELELPSGEYTQIRFMLGISDDEQETPGSWIEKGEDDGEYDEDVDAPLYVPSGGQTGYKAAAGEPFVVPVNGSVSVTADFDLRRAVVVTGNDRYILKPVLRLVVDEQAGEISGNIAGTTTLEEENTYVVYSYESGEYDDSEADADNGETMFPNAVNSSELNDLEDEDDYVLAYLNEGAYDLYGAKYDADGNPEVIPLGENVEVSAGERTTYDLEDVEWTQ